MNLRIDFIIHWLWALTYAILTLSGIALIGAKYGWIIKYNLALADYIHRVTAAIWCVLLLIAITTEIYQIYSGIKKHYTWLILGKKDFQLFTFFTALLFLTSGMYIWGGHGEEVAGFAFSLWLHETLTFIGIGSIIWHLYDKSHVLQIG